MEDWGKKLKNIRESKNLSLTDIEKETNINIRILNQIENGDFDKLPKGIFAKNFIRQYCEFIEFDSTELINDLFQEENQFEKLEIEQSTKNFDSFIKILKIAVVILFILLLSWLIYKRVFKTTKIENFAANEKVGYINSQMEKVERKNNKNEKNINNIDNNKNNDDVINNDIVTKANNSKTEIEDKKDMEKKVVVKPGKLQIEANEEDCWIHFVCNELEEDFIVKKGEIVSFSCNGEIIFDIGNVPAINITYNGVSLQFPKNKKVVKGFSINLDNIKNQGM